MISVTDPINDAFARTKLILFRPFDLGKWFVLGFSAFLAGLDGSGGACHASGNPFRSDDTKTASDIHQMWSWASAHLALVIGIGLVILALCLIVGMVLQWLSSRGHFMFLDCTVGNVAAVEEPWRQFRQRGNNLFVFRFLLGLVWVAFFLLMAALGWLIARQDILTRHFGISAILALVVCGLLFLAIAFGAMLVNLVLQDFIVPIMYRRNIGTLAACAVFAREILAGQIEIVALFYLLRFVLSLGAMAIMLTGICCTCCLAALPYLSSVVFLPVTIFFRCYSLYFLAQFGPEWQFFPKTATVVATIPCASP